MSSASGHLVETEVPLPSGGTFARLLSAQALLAHLRSGLRPLPDEYPCVLALVP